MPGKRRWTESEDEAIREAAACNCQAGQRYGRGGRKGRLAAVAEALGRSYMAVRNRAARIGASSRAPVASRDEAARSQGAESRR